MEVHENRASQRPQEARSRRRCYKTLGSGRALVTSHATCPSNRVNPTNDVLVFHDGAWITGAEQPSGEVVVFDRASLREVARYPDLAGWYGLLRAEYAARYGLT